MTTATQSQKFATKVNARHDYITLSITSGKDRLNLTWSRNGEKISATPSFPATNPELNALIKLARQPEGPKCLDWIMEIERRAKHAKSTSDLIAKVEALKATYKAPKPVVRKEAKPRFHAAELRTVDGAVHVLTVPFNSKARLSFTWGPGDGGTTYIEPAGLIPEDELERLDVEIRTPEHASHADWAEAVLNAFKANDVVEEVISDIRKQRSRFLRAMAKAGKPAATPKKKPRKAAPKKAAKPKEVKVKDVLFMLRTTDKDHRVLTATFGIALALKKTDPGMRLDVAALLRKYGKGKLAGEHFGPVAVGIADFIENGPGKISVREAIGDAENRQVARLIEAMNVLGATTADESRKLMRTHQDVIMTWLTPEPEPTKPAKAPKATAKLAPKATKPAPKKPAATQPSGRNIAKSAREPKTPLEEGNVATMTPREALALRTDLENAMKEVAAKYNLDAEVIKGVIDARQAAYRLILTTKAAPKSADIVDTLKPAKGNNHVATAPVVTKKTAKDPHAITPEEKAVIGRVIGAFNRSLAAFARTSNGKTPVRIADASSIKVLRKSDDAHDVEVSFRVLDKSTGEFAWNESHWLPTFAINHLVRWAGNKAVAAMVDSPAMVLAGDWLAIRNAGPVAIRNIFNKFVLKSK